jgi:circadian clock protein KaiB
MTLQGKGGEPAGISGLPDHRPARERYTLRLYVTGTTPRSLRAIENMRKICEENLKGFYDLEVIDIYQNPQASRDAQIVVAPTLVKLLPLPLRRFIGDLSDKEKILAGLDLHRRGGAGENTGV